MGFLRVAISRVTLQNMHTLQNMQYFYSVQHIPSLGVIKMTKPMETTIDGIGCKV
jgi:hypothetical protein